MTAVLVRLTHPKMSPAYLRVGDNHGHEWTIDINNATGLSQEDAIAWVMHLEWIWDGLEVVPQPEPHPVLEFRHAAWRNPPPCPPSQWV